MGGNFKLNFNWAGSLSLDVARAAVRLGVWLRYLRTMSNGTRRSCRRHQLEGGRIPARRRPTTKSSSSKLEVTLNCTLSGVVKVLEDSEATQRSEIRSDSESQPFKLVRLRVTRDGRALLLVLSPLYSGRG